MRQSVLHFGQPKVFYDVVSDQKEIVDSRELDRIKTYISSGWKIHDVIRRGNWIRTDMLPFPYQNVVEPFMFIFQPVSKLFIHFFTLQNGLSDVNIKHLFCFDGHPFGKQVLIYLDNVFNTDMKKPFSVRSTTNLAFVTLAVYMRFRLAASIILALWVSSSDFSFLLLTPQQSTSLTSQQLVVDVGWQI